VDCKSLVAIWLDFRKFGNFFLSPGGWGGGPATCCSSATGASARIGSRIQQRMKNPILAQSVSPSLRCCLLPTNERTNTTKKYKPTAVFDVKDDARAKKMPNKKPQGLPLGYSGCVGFGRLVDGFYHSRSLSRG
jgi:hypothetical protein